MFLIAFSLFILLSSILSLAGAVIALHFLRYGVQGDKSKVFATILLAGGGVLFVAAFLSFLSIPWDSIVEMVRALQS